MTLWGMYFAWDRALGFLKTYSGCLCQRLCHQPLDTSTSSCLWLATDCAMEMTWFHILGNPNCAHPNRKCARSFSSSLEGKSGAHSLLHLALSQKFCHLRCSLGHWIPSEPLVPSSLLISLLPQQCSCAPQTTASACLGNWDVEQARKHHH